MDNPDIQNFINRWQTSGAAERANFPQFAVELCELLEVPRPDPTTPHDNDNSYVFEKNVPLPHGTNGRIDLYKRGCFVMEAKQGSNQTNQPVTFSQTTLTQHQQRKRGTAVRGTASWDTAMEKAKQQAQSYARNLPLSEIENGRPPFLLVVDVGNSIALYSEFSRTGGNYVPFPDPSSYRLELTDLHDDNVRQLLRQIWLEPMSLDPSRRSARVTREIADRLARLARSLEQDHSAETVAQFLMRCLFTMFAEDVGLLPSRSFAQLLADIRHDVGSFKPMVEHLWQTMNTGGFSVILRTQIPRFNGGLFAQPTALPLNSDQLQLLVEAASADWRDVEPAIFGTLLERALDPIERHKLGAHYTPRAYVERLVKPTVIEPLRAEWESVQAAALLLANEGQTAKALSEVERFQRRLASIRILDPACGSGNFLYVTLEHLKRLEGEVLEVRRQLGAGQMLLDMESVTVSPQQFLGIEVNPRAAAIAELVLWIGYLQWHFRTRGNALPAEPIIRDFHNIECRDAVLAWDSVEPLLDEQGQPVTRWDGRTTKPHPVTGEQVPDETARIPAYRYLNPRPAEWPQADFIVGNPPFIANRNLRSDLGEGYTNALAKTFPEIKEAVDFVMYFWFIAAKKVASKEIARSGLITTNSIRMIQNQGIVKRAINVGAKITFAIPDHPWPGETLDAKVRISMTVIGHRDVEVGRSVLMLAPGHDQVASSRMDEISYEDFSILSQKNISPDLSPLVDISEMVELQAWRDLCHAGMKPYAKDLIISEEKANFLFPAKNARIRYAPPYRNGSDVARKPRKVHVIDFFGIELDEIIRDFPEAYQHLQLHVKPQRATVRNPRLQKEWWLFEANRPILRQAIEKLPRYLVTVENSPVRYFVFLPSSILPDQKLRVVASDDAYFLGILSSRLHEIFALRAGGRQGVANTPVYNTRCCTFFPFPDSTESQEEYIRQLAEELDAHRKRQQAQHSKLTMTGMYNVLEKLRAEELLDDKERQIHEQGLVSILKQLHDDLDKAVFAAYGWSPTLSDEEILQRLVDLNAERAAEEARGHIRWLRPDYQATQQPIQVALLDTDDDDTPAPASEQRPWPTTMAEQAQTIRAILAASTTPILPADIAVHFGKRSKPRITRITELLETLVALGQAREGENGGYSL